MFCSIQNSKVMSPISGEAPRNIVQKFDNMKEEKCLCSQSIKQICDKRQLLLTIVIFFSVSLSSSWVMGWMKTTAQISSYKLGLPIILWLYCRRVVYCLGTQKQGKAPLIKFGFGPGVKHNCKCRCTAGYSVKKKAKQNKIILESESIKIF